MYTFFSILFYTVKIQQIISDNSTISISIMSDVSNCIVEQVLEVMKLTISIVISVSNSRIHLLNTINMLPCVCSVIDHSSKYGKN